jgi:prevent-host-death family protein
MNVTPKIKTMTSRAFNQDTARAKRAAEEAPVFITTRGQPTHVLMSIGEFRRLEKGKFVSLADILADDRPEADFDWEPPRLGGFSLKVPDLD